MIRIDETTRILVVAAHPDDEVLGLGATINKMVHEHGCEVRCVILGEGITSRAEVRDRDSWRDELARLHENVELARNAIGYASVQTHDFPDNRFDSVPLLDIVKVIEREKDQFRPGMIFTHHSGDVNIDHRRTFDAVIAATRPMQNEIVETLITFETPSSTEWQASTHPEPFVPNWFVEISTDQLMAKIGAMESYEMERRDFPHPRSSKALEILAQRWGVVIGAQYAESFRIIRSISRNHS